MIITNNERESVSANPTKAGPPVANELKARLRRANRVRAAVIALERAAAGTPPI